MPEPKLQHDASIEWTWNDSPDSNDDILSVFVKTELIRPVDVFESDGTTLRVKKNKPQRELQPFNDRPYTAPSTFKDLDPLFGRDYLLEKGVGDWWFVGSQKVAPNTTAFHYFRNKTADEEVAPIKEKSITGNHWWPMVVRSIWLEEDDAEQHTTNNIEDSGKLSIVTAPTTRIRDDVLPDISEGSEIITRQYLSALQPPPKVLPVPQPMAMDVIAPNGERRQYDKVLHDDIRVASSRSGTRKYISGGQVSSVGGAIGEQFYPSTNFPERRAYIVSFDPEQDQYGLWLTTEIEVRPPKIIDIDR